MSFRIASLRSGTSLLVLATLPAALGCAVAGPGKLDHGAMQQCFGARAPQPARAASGTGARWVFERASMARGASPWLEPATRESARASFCNPERAGGGAAPAFRFGLMEALLLGFGLAMARAEQEPSEGGARTQRRRIPF